MPALAFEHQPYNRDRYSVLAALLAKTHDRPAYEKLCKRPSRKLLRHNQYLRR